MIEIKAFCDGSVKTTIVSQHHRWHIDEPVAFGGEDTAPSPVEMLLGSIAGCIVAVGHLIAEEMDLPFTTLEILIRGTINAERFFGRSDRERAGFQSIQITARVPDEWTVEQCEEWSAKVVQRCPVIDNLTHPTSISLHFE